MWEKIKKYGLYLLLPIIFIYWLIQYVFLGHQKQLNKITRKLEEEKLKNAKREISRAEEDAQRAVDDWNEFKRRIQGTDDDLS